MEVSGIVANVIDRCGGDLIERVNSATATLHVLNVLELYGLELANTFKGSFAIKRNERFSAQSGALSAESSFIYRPQYVRYRGGDSNAAGWQELFVLNDIEELTKAENTGVRAIWFSKVKPFAYQLSFMPQSPIDVEIWGQNYNSQLTALSAVPALPEEFSQLVAVEASIRFLDDLLLLDNAARYQAFFVARKRSLEDEKRQLRRLWNNFKERDENRNVEMRRVPFDIFGESSEFLNMGYE